MKEKSIGTNAILNTTKTMVSLLFPLITFPYITRVLLVENLGRVNYADSIVSYFSLIALLGVKTYATREGSQVRNNPYEFQKFFSEIFSITVITTIISYLLLGIMAVGISSLHSYIGVISILSTSIFFTTLGAEWVCSVYEDYVYITIRSIFFQIISLILIFIMVRDINDIYQYAIVLVISSSGANIVNCIYIRKYCKLRFTIHMNLRRHIKPIMILFASTLATSIYVSSDITILGAMCGDYYTGLYSTSTKIYSIVKNLFGSILVVSIPRFSVYFSQGRKTEYNNLFSKLSNILTILGLPSSVGIFMLSSQIITLISGESYLDATSSLRILSIAIPFVAASWLLSQCILIPMKYEGYVLKITILTMILNIILNFLLVPHFNQNATAFTTLFAEFIVMLLYVLKLRGKIYIEGFIKQVFNSMVGCIGIVIWLCIITKYIEDTVLCLLFSISGGCIIYFYILFLLKDRIVREGIQFAKNFNYKRIYVNSDNIENRNVY